MNMIPFEYLELSLADLLRLFGDDAPRAPRRSVSTIEIAHALDRLASELHKREQSRAANARDWLAAQLEALQVD